MFVSMRKKVFKLKAKLEKKFSKKSICPPPDIDLDRSIYIYRSRFIQDPVTKNFSVDLQECRRKRAGVALSPCISLQWKPPRVSHASAGPVLFSAGPHTLSPQGHMCSVSND